MIQSVMPMLTPLEHAQCDTCRLCGGERPERPVLGYGPKTASFVVVGEVPSHTDARTGRPFMGESGRLFTSEINRLLRIPKFRDLPIGSYQLYLTNTLACPIPEGETVSVKSIKACQPRLYAELAELNPTVILCLGSTAATVIRGRKSSITNLIGHTEWSEDWQAHLAYTYNPAAVLREPGMYNDFLWGLHTAADAMLLPEGPRVYPEIEYMVASEADLLPTLTFLEDALHSSLVSCDLETTGLRPGLDLIRSIGFTQGEERTLIMPWELVESNALVRELTHRVVSKRDGSIVLGHNYGFDVRHLWANGMPDAHVGGDTMLLHYALDERTGRDGGGAHDLKTLARKYCDAPNYAEGIDRADMANVNAAEMYQYQAYDCVYTYRLYGILRELLSEEEPSREGYPSPLEMYERLLVPAANTLARVESRGIQVDLSRLSTMLVDYERKVNDAVTLARSQLGDASKLLKSAFNPNSPKQMATVLYTPRMDGGLGYPIPPRRRGKPVDSRPTDEEAIHYLQRWERETGATPNPLLDTALDYRSLLHTRSTYLDGIWDHLERNSPHDYRLRGSFHIPGTTSGRLSSSRPNMQNMPARSVIKNMFVARPGYVLCNADYRRLEVGVLAWYSRDAQLITDFMAADFHWNVASKVFAHIVAEFQAATTVEELTDLADRYAVFTEISQRQARPDERIADFQVLYDMMKELLRRQAKYISFGKMYGEGAESLSKPEKGMGVSVEVAQQYSELWDAQYPDAIAFLREQSRIARQERWLETPNGRRRRFGYPRNLERHLANEAMNFPIQSFAADMCLVSLTRLENDLTADGLGYPLLTVHDSILFELHLARLEEAKAKVHDTMTTVITDPEIVFEIDMKTGRSWGECH